MNRQVDLRPKSTRRECASSPWYDRGLQRQTDRETDRQTYLEGEDLGAPVRPQLELALVALDRFRQPDVVCLERNKCDQRLRLERSSQVPLPRVFEAHSSSLFQIHVGVSKKD